MRKGTTTPFGVKNFLSVFEGIEGGFAIFAGIILGLSFGHVTRDVLIVTAVISIVVNAINSSVVRFSSEHYLDELDGHEKKRWQKEYLSPAIVEFIVYMFVSVISILPLMLIPDLNSAIIFMCSITEIILFGAGFYRGRLLMKRGLVDGFEVAVGGLAIMLAGAGAGWALAVLF
jgi:VIT1/CCC1 family predicted Fe2+/Mn2+ transporter